MLEQLLHWERDLFFTLHGHHTAFWDNVMWLYSGQFVWLPVALFLLLMLTRKIPWRESLLVLLAIAVLIVLCDQFSSHICKPLFMRFRPTHHPDFMDQVQTVFGYRGGKYGFISGHAANTIGLATLMSLLFRNRLFTATIFCWALVMAYSRIYLGVHFISDIVPGILSGLAFGTLTYYLYIHVRRRILCKGGKEAAPAASVYSPSRKYAIVAAIWLTIILILIFNTALADLLR